jgi:hypothetical protein
VPDFITFGKVGEDAFIEVAVGVGEEANAEHEAGFWFVM